MGSVLATKALRCAALLSDRQLLAGGEAGGGTNQANELVYLFFGDLGTESDPKFSTRLIGAHFLLLLAMIKNNQKYITWSISIVTGQYGETLN